jgi:hypothetical protein
VTTTTGSSTAGATFVCVDSETVSAEFEQLARETKAKIDARVLSGFFVIPSH